MVSVSRKRVAWILVGGVPGLYCLPEDSDLYIRILHANSVRLFSIDNDGRQGVVSKNLVCIDSGRVKLRRATF